MTVDNSSHKMMNTPCGNYAFFSYLPGLVSAKEIMGKNIVAEKSYRFAISVIQLYKWLCEEKKGYVISKQFLKRGTAIGALIKEAEHAQSKRDFLNKINIALKEANETEYWLILLHDAGYLSLEKYIPTRQECSEINKLLIRIVKTTKESLFRQ